MVTTGQAGQRIFALARAVGWVFPVELARRAYNGVKAVARAPKRAAATVMLAALPYVAQPSEGAMIEQTLVNDSTVRETWVNDDNGAELNAWEARALTDLVTKIYNTDNNSSRFASASDLFSNASVGTAPGSEVDFGWNVVHEDGMVKYANNGGFAGFDYEVWFADQQNPSQNEARKFLNFTNALDTDGDGELDYRIIKTDTPMEDAGRAFVGGSSVPAPGVEYNVVPIPEPATLATLLAGGAFMMRRRRR
jgi:hypothetical protein